MTFDHLLGLSVESALAILKSYGITDVETAMTAAPRRAAQPPDAEAEYASLRVVAVRDDGRTLIVSRFRTGDPKPPPTSPERNANE